MTQNDQSGFLKKNCYSKNSVLIMASLSLVLGCGLQKSQSNNAPESEVKNEKSIEEEVKEQTATNQEKKTDKEVTKDQLVSFLISKGLLPKDTDTKTLKFADLGSFSGTESQCSFYELASSYVCVDKDVVYIDSAVGGVERWGHFRVPSPHIRNVIPSGDKTVTVCGVSFGVSALLYYACTLSTAAIPPACTGMAAASAGSSCAVSIGTASATCNTSVATLGLAATACIAQSLGKDVSEIKLNF